MPQQTFWRKLAPAGAVAAIVFFSLGTGVYAYESPSVTEGHPLNIVKQNLERAEGWLANNPEARVRFHAKMMDRRMNEARFAGLGNEKADALLAAAAEQLDMSTADLREEMRDPETRVQIMEELADKGVAFAETWQEHRENFGEGKARGFGFGRPIMGQDEDPRLPPPGFGMSEEVKTLRDSIFADESLSLEEQREAFHEGMKVLLDKHWPAGRIDEDTEDEDTEDEDTEDEEADEAQNEDED